jgi:hypothetical protein
MFNMFNMFNIFLHGYDGLQTDSISTSTSQIFSIRMDHNGSIWRSAPMSQIQSSHRPTATLQPCTGLARAIGPGHPEPQVLIHLAMCTVCYATSVGKNPETPRFRCFNQISPETRRNPSECLQSPGAVGRSTKVPSVLGTQSPIDLGDCSRIKHAIDWLVVMDGDGW